MIKTLKRLGTLPNTVSAVRTVAVYNAYRKNGGAAFYRVLKNGKTVGVISHCGGCSLTVTGDADFKELDSFFGIFGCEVFTEAETARFLSPKSKKEVSLLRLCGKVTSLTAETEANCKTLYKTLRFGTDGDISLPEFDEFYADFLIRKNHGSAISFQTENSAAISLFVTTDGALITGVATKGTERRKGHGSDALFGLIAKIKALYGDIPVYAAVSEKNKPFYYKNGFEEIGKAAILYY